MGTIKTAVILLSHGSKQAGADGVTGQLLNEVKAVGGYEIVQPAFLQYGAPGLTDVIEQCVHMNADRIIIVPFFMQRGAHVARDIPDTVEQARKKHPGVAIRVTDFVGAHRLMVDIVLDLVENSA